MLQTLKVSYNFQLRSFVIKEEGSRALVFEQECRSFGHLRVGSWKKGRTKVFFTGVAREVKRISCTDT